MNENNFNEKLLSQCDVGDVIKFKRESEWSKEHYLDLFNLDQVIIAKFIDDKYIKLLSFEYDFIININVANRVTNDIKIDTFQRRGMSNAYQVNCISTCRWDNITVKIKNKPKIDHVTTFGSMVPKV